MPMSTHKLSNQHLINFLFSTTEPPALGDGGLPSNVVDIWEFLGKNIETQYTWDMLINTNLEESGKELQIVYRLFLVNCFLHINMTTVLSKHFGTSIFIESFA